MCAEDIILKTMEGSKHYVIVGGQTINILRDAYDTTLLATSVIDINENFTKLVQESKTSNMSINAKNTKLMVAGRSCKRCAKTLLERDEIEQVENLRFFGSTKTTNGVCTKEIKKSIAIAKEKITKLSNIWTSANISRQLKVRFTIM